MSSLKQNFLAVALISLLSLPAYSKSMTVQELQQDVLPKYTNVSNDTSGIFTQDHWAYKALEKVSKKYGLLVGKPEEKFDGSKPLLRSEAAILLMSLVGQIEQRNYDLTEAEKTQIDILRQELKNEIHGLTRRVDSLETSVNALKGSVSKLEESDKKEWKYDFGEKFKINGAFQARYTGIINKGSDNYSPNFRIPLAELKFSGRLHNHLNYELLLKPDRAFTSSSKGLLGDAFISTDIIPHHNIIFGQSRVPIGYEGTLSSSALDTIDRSQIARNFGDVRDLGIKAVGNWSLIDYTLGAFNGNGQNANDTNSDMNISSWAVFKPLWKYPQFGKLELGGGYNIGRNGSIQHQNIMSGYAGYKYKNYSLRAEYASANSYLSTDRKARGWYLHNTYDLTKKIQMVGRFDQFDPDTRIADNRITEYTLGMAYYLSGNNLKLLLNYVHVEDKAGKDADRIGMQTQYKF